MFDLRCGGFGWTKVLYLGYSACDVNTVFHAVFTRLHTVVAAATKTQRTNQVFMKSHVLMS